MPQPSTELLNTTLADLGSTLVMTNAQSMPLMDQLMKKKKVNCEPRGGTYIERSFSGGSPAEATRIDNGDEVAVITRRAQIRKFQVTSTRHFVPIFIPQVEVDRNSGKNGIIKLIKQYPEMTAVEYFLDWERFLLTGGYRNSAVSCVRSPGFLGSCTLNGAVTAGAAGLLDFAAPSAQTDVVQGVAKSEAIGNINQYGVVTSFAGDGMLQVGLAYDTAAGNSRSGPDLGFADMISYQQMVTYSGDNVRITSTDQPVYGAESRSFLPYKKAKLYASLQLDPTDAAFTGTTGFSTSSITGGVIYWLSSDDWEVPYYKMEVTPEFRDDIPNQDGLLGKMVIDMGPICTRLNTQAVVGGTRIP